MSRNELELALQWAAEEGWNPGLSDAECFYPVDSTGYFMGFLGKEPVGSISAVCYDASFAFLGLYIVRPEYRGKGYGLAMWKKAMEHIEDRIVGLDGVLAQQNNYKKSGFKLGFHNFRFHGRSKKYKTSEKSIVKLSTLPFENILFYDSSLFPTPRPSFLHCWINHLQHTVLGFVHNSKLVGYGVVRKCMNGYKIGPLFADDKNIAQHLFEALNNSIEEHASIFLDIPEINLEAIDLVKSYTMTPMFETARMYKGLEPKLPLYKIFGITTFELG